MSSAVTEQEQCETLAIHLVLLVALLGSCSSSTQLDDNAEQARTQEGIVPVSMVWADSVSLEVAVNFPATETPGNSSRWHWPITCLAARPIGTQKRAISLMPENIGEATRAEYLRNLRTYEAAMEAQEGDTAANVIDQWHDELETDVNRGRLPSRCK